MIICTEFIELVMIVDENSALAAMTVIESIVMNAGVQTRSRLRISVVSNGGEDSDGNTFEKNFLFSLSCFEISKVPGMLRLSRFEQASLVPPILQAPCQESKHICARFYIPSIFPDLDDRYIYLDNDVLVTCDIKELWEISIVRLAHFEERTSVPIDKKKSQPYPHHDSVKKFRGVNGGQVRNQISTPGFPTSQKSHNRIQRRRLFSDSKKLKVLRSRNPAASFVWEKHPFYEVYIEGNFNTSHPLVAEIIRRRGNKRLFLNAGVAVMDVVTWNLRNVTRLFEKLLLSNLIEKVFNFDSAGDQACFYLMNEYLDLGAIPHARFNMRRLPKKTIQLLKTGATGIIHWAGTTGVHTEELCLHPGKYPLLAESGAMSHFKQVVNSYHERCPKSKFQYDKQCLLNVY